jgi:hypothetical protein
MILWLDSFITGEEEVKPQTNLIENQEWWDPDRIWSG